ncbi:light-harvesting complex-like protein OHP2, chloroplastic [Macadamia integrifolia]|uniref:light-harvesting complex-like protein OHP2, chloroplastic n=1 Tax=Macadamia integrifolia TaxID=60698 RepID=UPI001C4F52AC|nr:light-harvesting complex-like protein OHP2, chloroplastic [Macadamia integrifolia]
MSLASSSIPCVKISSSSYSSSSTTTCSSSSSSSSSSSIKFSATKPSITIRNSNAEGPIRRPVAPSLRQPSAPVIPIPQSPSPSQSPSPPSPPSAPSKPVSVAGVSQVSDPNVITMEFQRKMAKELQEYFRQKKLEKADQGPFFGFIGKNEIANGRWAMFGFAVGLLTEYATGSDFVDQVKILFSNFGILDLD